jgi:hypothetical protein
LASQQVLDVQRRLSISHRFSGLTVEQILKLKKGSIRQVQLSEGSPTWETLQEMTWEQIEINAAMNLAGFRTIRKLLSDRRFDR